MKDFKAISDMLKETEKAINTLKDYQRPQIEFNKNYILSQVCNYICETLKEANWIFCSVKYFSSIYIAPSHNNDSGFVLYIGNGSATGIMRPCAYMSPSVLELFGDLSDKEVIVLTRNWAEFKKCFNNEIRKRLEEKQKKLNKEIQHLAHIQDVLNNFEV